MGLELTDNAKKFLAKKGYDPVLGARPLRRTIQREIEDSLSERILFNELRPGQIVVVDCEGDPDDIEKSKLIFSGADRGSTCRTRCRPTSARPPPRSRQLEPNDGPVTAAGGRAVACQQVRLAGRFDQAVLHQPGQCPRALHLVRPHHVQPLPGHRPGGVPQHRQQQPAHLAVGAGVPLRAPGRPGGRRRAAEPPRAVRSEGAGRALRRRGRCRPARPAP